MFDVYQIYTTEEAALLRAALLDCPWQEGKARTEELTGTVKQNYELKAEHSLLAREKLVDLQQRLRNNEQIMQDHFLSKLTLPKFNKYCVDGPAYHRHGDSAIMGSLRTDLSCTVFLTPPDDYEGGVLCLETSNGSIVTAKGKAGSCIVYPSGQPHWVTPVIEGERISAICWFQSAIRDLAQRDLLRRMTKSLKNIEVNPTELQQDLTTLGIIHGNLLRMFMD